MSKPRVGFFSPILDGGIHLRTLEVALVSYLESRSAKGTWFIDFPDSNFSLVKQQTEQWLLILEAYGFDWDNEASERVNCPRDARDIVDQWLMHGLAYACHCKEDQLKEIKVYPGFCRDALKPIQNAAIRLRTPDLIYQFTDSLQGVFKQNISQEIGDFVIRDKQGVVDADLIMVLISMGLGATQIVRPIEQLSTVVKQLYLQELLGFSSPTYLHVPAISNNPLYSNSLASLLTLSEHEKVMLLFRLLEQLGQPVSADLQKLTPRQLLSYAADHWCIQLIPKGR